MKAGKLKLNPDPGAAEVTYHDPCALGRAGLCVYESPRAVLEQLGLNLVEGEFNKEFAQCCGSGMLHEIYPAMAQTAAGNALQPLARTGAPSLVTACPSCKGAFEAQRGDGAPRVVDFIELVAEALEP